MTGRVVVVAAVVITAGASSAALAQPGTAAPTYGPEPAPAPVEGSYKRDIAKVDGVAGILVGTATVSGIVCFAEAFGTESSDTPPSCVLAAGTFIAGGATYVLGSPIVHLSKGNPGRAALALAARVGLPVLGYHLGEAAGGSDNAVGWGTVAGFGGALLLDWFVLADGDPPATASPTPRPYVTPTYGGVSAGVGGTF